MHLCVCVCVCVVLCSFITRANQYDHTWSIKIQNCFITVSSFTLLQRSHNNSLIPIPILSCLPPSPANGLHLYSLVISRILPQWNHRVCNLLRLALSTQHDFLSSVQIAAYIDNLFLLMAAWYSMVWMYQHLTIPLLKDTQIVSSLGLLWILMYLKLVRKCQPGAAVFWVWTGYNIFCGPSVMEFCTDFFIGTLQKP